MRRYLYHGSSASNRRSISSNGLLVRTDKTGLGAIFLADTKKGTEGFDLWQVDVTGLDVEEDCTTEPEEGVWYMCFSDISVNRLLLLPGEQTVPSSNVSTNGRSGHPLAILVAAITGTLPHDWSNFRHFSWANGDFEEAPSLGPSHGNDVFSKTAMRHVDGREAMVSYDLCDQVYVDCRDTRWSGPLEDEAHVQATLRRNFEEARQAVRQALVPAR